MAIGLLVLGVAIAVGSLIFGVVNMGKPVSSVPDGSESTSFSYGAAVKSLIGAMIGMVIGGCLFVIGVGMGAAQFLATR